MKRVMPRLISGHVEMTLFAPCPTCATMVEVTNLKREMRRGELSGGWLGSAITGSDALNEALNIMQAGGIGLDAASEASPAALRIRRETLETKNAELRALRLARKKSR